MIKTLTLCLLTLLITGGAAMGQTSKNDSLATAGKKDAKQFKLDNALWQQFRHQGFANTSDYFKPHAVDVNDPSMLNDSAYVHAYRREAYKQTVHRHTTGHYFLIYGGIATFILLVTAIIAAATITTHLNFSD